MMALVILMALLAICSQRSTASNTPILPEDYYKFAGAGFATNYFKTLKFSKYNPQNVKDVKARGFKNLRLRCRADVEGLNMTTFLNNLELVVDDCLEEGIAPIISWIHHTGEAFANETHRVDYLDWWEQVAKKLKCKDYRLTFNLFTELGVDYCIQHNIDPCDEALAQNKKKYNNWTAEVIQRIRATGGKNDKRIIIMGSPKKTGKFLRKIDESIYDPNLNGNDIYLMAEWHQYASGPNKKPGGAKYWEGDGSNNGTRNVDFSFSFAANWTATSNISTYFGAWMPQDNKEGDINQTEAILFSRYFIDKLKPIPWTLNVLDVYYDTETCKWNNDIQNIKGANLTMSAILDEIIKVMPK